MIKFIYVLGCLTAHLYLKGLIKNSVFQKQVGLKIMPYQYLTLFIKCSVSGKLRECVHSIVYTFT